MNDRTIADTNSGIMPPVSDSNNQTPCNPERTAERPMLAISATFTADPLLQPLQFWIETIDLPMQVAVAPYGQLLRELLDPQSMLSQNHLGCNVLLLRLEDWIRERRDETERDNIDHVRRVARELASAVERLLERSRAALFVFFCPRSSQLAQSYVDVLTDVEAELLAQFRRLPRTHCSTHADIICRYPAIAQEDERTDRIAHIPYTNEYFVALATLLARAGAALLKPQPKVIAIDCDNTLWRGICGEDGAAGVHLTPAHLELQRALVRQHDAGALLCLCSKNNPDDVAEVFAKHPQMPLREEHLICSRVNWQSKSANLSSLAQELGLALDSFVLLDDSALECAEVKAHSPAVLTLQVPDTQDGIAHFVRHCWAFDRLVVTDEGRRRTEQYRENQARREAQRSATDLESFLASLQLEVRIEPMSAVHLERVAELIQRTNQFNLTTVRRHASEIAALAESGTLRSLVVHARDRFGDYGLVGAVFYRQTADALDVDTWVLSCRALGRGVEHRIVNELGRIARDTGLAHVLLRFRRSPRNAPAAQFLQGSFRDFRVDSIQREEEIYAVPAAFAATVGAAAGQDSPEGEDTQLPRASAPFAPTSMLWHQAALQLGDFADLVRAVEQHAARRRRREGHYVGPRTGTEGALAAIWRELLGLPDVGVEDDFFALGGDSLLAVRVVARIESTLGLELPLNALFEAPTVSQLAQRLGNAVASASIEAVGRDQQLPLSWSQQRLWFIDVLEGGSAAYHIPIALRLHGRLNRAALESSLQHVAQRHEILRTVFVKSDSGEPVQRILLHGRFPLRTVDLMGARDPGDMLEESRAELLEPFDLAAGPLVRGRLLQLSADEHVLLITMHHIVSDGWSLDIQTRELAALYTAYCTGTPDGLQPLSIQYADYAHWQHATAASPLLQQQVEYWHEHLQGAPTLLELPTDRPRPPALSYRGANLTVGLSVELVAQLKQLCRQHNITLAMALNAAWSIVLARLSGQTDIVIGMPIANRRRTQLEGLIGLFVNTLAVRFRLDDDPAMPDLLQRVKQVMLGAYANQDAPFEQVVDRLRPPRSLSHSPIFQAMLVLQSPAEQPLQLPGLRMAREDVALHTAQFDLLLSLQESSWGLTGFLNYATDLFDPKSIERWFGYFECVLRALVSSPQLQVSRLPLLSDVERRLLVDELNATRAPYGQNETIHGLFEEQVRRTAHAPAVWFEGQSLTYAELNARANQLARHLRDAGVGPDQLVGLCAERSIELVVGLLGILKAGGAYVPIDPDYPPERVAYMLKDAAPAVLLTQAHLLTKLPATSARVLALDADWEQVMRQPDYDLDCAAVGVNSRHLIYVIYTSGSTGRPKGAMNEHRAVVNRLQWMQHEYGLAQHDRVLQKTPFSFDVSAWEFFWTLMTGACLIVARPRGHQDPGYLRQLIEQTGVTTLHFVPSMLQVFLDEHRPGQCACIRRVICSGEELPASLQRKFHESLPEARLANLYGPTEAAIDVTYWECQAAAVGSRVPIGRPIWNVQMYVLDAHREPAPSGVTGEIYIGGVGVGRGYLNRPELTAERFVADPFGTDPAARLYRTGDLGRWRGDGALEYLGRNDHQVKIRGLRIELGEIEAELLRDPRVKETVVIAREDVAGDKRLVAYLVPLREQEHESALSAEELRARLKASLPDYMVPSAFVLLKRMPLSPNGKLERRALPAPDREALARRPYAPPAGAVEEALAGIWQGLLRVGQVGRHDNFFELGGHSLLIVQMMERLRALGLSADLRQVFESDTLAELAAALRREAPATIQAPPNLIPDGCSHITPEMLPLVQLEQEHIERIVATVPAGASNVQDIYPLAPLQEGILFHHLLSGRAGDTYVVPTVLAVSSRQRLDELIAALQAVIDRHDVLRTAVVWETLPQPVQVVYRRAPLPVEEIGLDSTRDVLGQVRDWMQPEQQVMDLRLAPLLHLRIAEDPSNTDRWYVLMRLHHIIGDNRSQEAVIAEVIAHLHARAASLPTAVPYREHVAQALALAQRRADESEAFFRSKLGNVAEPTAPFGLLDVHGDGARTCDARAQLDADVVQRARQQARQLGVSTATFFHAAWSLVVAHTSGRDDVVFGTVLLGRMQGSAGAQQTLGMFINTLPLRLQLCGLTARQLVEQTQRELIELVSHEQASLAAAQKCSGVSGSAPLFTTLLNFRHGVGGTQAHWADADGLEVVAVHERTNYPITLSLDDSQQGILLTAQTDTRIDARRLVGYLQEAAGALAKALESAPDTRALELPILPAREREQIILELNATAAPYPDGASHVLFEQQVRCTPDVLAAVYEQERLTYAQLNSRANRLAHYLRAQGVEPGQYVPVMLTRSLQMLIAHLAVLKCGAVYVPMDPELPLERRSFMVRDCGAARVVTDGGRPSGQEEIGVTCIDCTAAWRETERQWDTDLDVPCGSEAPAYVMYTSGSTGVPKGVVVPHRAVNRLAINNGFAEIGADDCIVHYSNPAFDASTFEIWGALLSGARVLIVPQPIVLEGERFAQLLEHEGATILYMSVGLFNQYTQVMASVFRRLRCLMVGGDSLEPTAIRRVLSESPPQRLLNAYGPTECTTFATTHHIETVAEGTRSIPIGRPMSNAQIYILDRRGEVVPRGVVGELHIGGAGVACGYLNRPELTAERFIRDPFNADPGARLYRTGDLARWRHDGAIDFLGRNDQQVKLRGFRVELGEIEARLVEHEQVKEACVVARQDGRGEKRLVAYVVPLTLAGAPRVDELRNYLKTRLPEYMVPSAFVLLERMPLSSSGKVERRALPAPDVDSYAQRDYEPPLGPVEEILAGVWQDILQVEQVGRRDNFFELGGHSLLMVQMMERLRHVGLSTEVRRVFESPTLAELASVLTGEAAEQYEVPPNLIPPGAAVIEPQMLPLVELEPAHIERIVQAVPGGASNVEDIYPLVPLQEGILFHHLLDEGNGDTYVLPTVLSVASHERLAELVAALQTVIDRHPVLRTAVLWEQLPRALQVVYRQAALPVDEVTFDPARSVPEQIAEWIRPQRQWLDIRQAPLLRLQIAPDPQSARWYVMLQLHHMTIDHVALEIVTSEVVAHMEGRAQPPAESVHYRNHVAQSLAYAREHDAEAFFRGKLADIDEPTAPFGLLDVHGDGTQIEDAYEAVEPALTARIRSQARRLGVSAATLFHAGWALVVAHTSGRDDVVFGSVLLGRLQVSAGAQRTLGMFINTLPLRLRLQSMTAKGLVEQTQRELVELLGHEQASLAIAQRRSGIGGTTPLFSALLNYRHSVPNSGAEWESASGVDVVASQERTNYPVTLSVDDLGHGFTLKAQVDRQVPARRMTSYLHTAMRSLIGALEQAPQTPALGLTIEPEAEARERARFNATAIEYPRHALIHQLFEAQVRRTPAAPAVVHGKRAFTYEELNAHANRLARRLRGLGVGANDIVGICVERRPEMVVGVLGSLKAGAGYLPLDPSYPRERLAYMLEDAAPRVVLTQRSLHSSISDATRSRIVLLDDAAGEVADTEAADLSAGELGLSSDTLLYVIYTSGSTGRPKGTVMPHRAMVNLIEWHRRGFGEQSCRVLQFAALSFDVAFQEIFSTLCTGGTLVLLDEWVRRDTPALLELLERERIERLFVPPLMLQSLAECSRDGTEPRLLRDIITAGEQLRISPEIVGFFERLPHCRLHNHYGPTETHVVTAVTLPGPARSWSLLPSIGKPIANTQIHILDEQRQPVLLGVAGEVYIAGANVARGYLHRPELTQQRFVPDPFSGDPAARMYRTGDLARWQADGAIEYLGRNDYQVKLRGYRIELGEIEARLMQHEAVKEAAVVARDDAPGQKRLVAYVTPRAAVHASADELCAYAKSVLPEYMVPSAFVVLDELPLTPSGKLNRRALPAPELQAYAIREYLSPSGPVEEAVAQTWCAVLGLERIGRDDDFFELGGHSLLALKALFKTNQALGVALRVADMYRNPTIRSLAQRISCGVAEDEHVDLPREAILSPDITPQPGSPRMPARAILLTGATGFVGRFLLSELLAQTSAKVYCLVRVRSAQQAQARLRSTLLRWELWREEFASRIVAVAGDLRRPRLGLDDDTFERLGREVDSIHHCATSMNHLETYAMAKPANVDAARDLLRLAVLGRPKLVNYISTLGVFNASASEARRVVYENTPIDHELHRRSQGYTASKWVAEKLFLTAAQRGIPCNVFRLGLVWADSEKGRFDESQNVYQVLKSSLLSGYGIKDYQYPMPPTPVDYVARAIVFLASRYGGDGRVFHISSAQQAIDDLFEHVGEVASTPLQLLPYYDWIRVMKRLHEAGTSLPAVPLIEYAFTMSEDTFRDHQRRVRSAANVRFDFSHTHAELQHAGIVAPKLTDELLRVCLEGMFANDPDLQQPPTMHPAVLAAAAELRRARGLT